MNIVVEELGRSDLSVFMEDYFSFAATACPEQKLVGYDFFIDLPKARKTPRQFRLLFRTFNGTQMCLLDSEMNVLCSYDEIIPMFRGGFSSGLQEVLRRLMGELRQFDTETIAMRTENRLAIETAVMTEANPFRHRAQAYLVRKGKFFGVVDSHGKILIEPKYRFIRPLAFEEDYLYPCILENEVSEANANLYICQTSPRELNSTDVYDMDGNKIFCGIGSLFPCEEILTTPADCGLYLDAELPTSRRIKSLWVCQQVRENLYEDCPDITVINDRHTKYSVRKLLSPKVTPDGLLLAPIRNTSTWQWDYRDYHTIQALHRSAFPRPLLRQLVNTVADGLGRSPVEIMQRLGDYLTFKKELEPVRNPFAELTADSPLNKLDMTVRAYNVLRRSGIHTVGDLVRLSEERLSQIRGINHKTMVEVLDLQSRLNQYFPDET